MLEIKQVTDLTSLMQWRREVIEHVFGEQPSESLMNANLEYYNKHISDCSHIAIEALIDGEKAGCGSICLTDELPSPDNPSGHCAYLMNIYVKDRFREHGVAHKIVERLIEESRKRDCGKIYLETTAEGRGVYESLGFRDLPDMMKLKNENK